MTEISDDDCVQVSPDRKTVWVHAKDGSTVGRFSKVFGMDVHTTFTEQLAGASECLRCTHVTPGLAEWNEFCDLIQRHYAVTVDRAALTFDEAGAQATRECTQGDFA